VFKKIDFPGGEAEALAYVVSRNLKRRHLTVAQRSIIAGKIAALKRGQTQIGPGTDLKTQAQAANMLDVSVSSVGRAKTVLDRGSPELVAAVEADEISLRGVAEIVRSDAELKPPRPDDTAKIAEANTRKYVESNARIRQRQVQGADRR
jgi:hypothetical protein